MGEEYRFHEHKHVRFLSSSLALVGKKMVLYVFNEWKRKWEDRIQNWILQFFLAIMYF